MFCQKSCNQDRRDDFEFRRTRIHPARPFSGEVIREQAIIIPDRRVRAVSVVTARIKLQKIHATVDFDTLFNRQARD